MNAQRIKPTLYDGVVMYNTHVAMPVIDDEETLILEEESRSKMSKKAKAPEVIAKKISHKPIDYEKINSLTEDLGKLDVPNELPKVSLVNASLKKLKFHLTQFDSVVKKRTTPNALEEEIQEYFEINNLKARLQDKDKTICKLKDTIKFLRKNTKEENINHDKCELEPINEELENSVENLLSKNEHLCNEINHVKQDLKAQIQDKVFVITSLKNDLRKLKGKEIVENVVHIPSATTISPGMFKLDLVPLSPRLLQNREPHIDYLRHTQEQANTLREIVEQAKAKQPLDKELNFACKYATRIQELLVYVQDTCPNVITPSTRKVESSNTSDSNTPMLSSTGVKCSTSNCGSKPLSNKNNDRISQTPSRNKKNKVEAQPRKVNQLNRVVKPICDIDVKHSLSNANSKILCATCNKSMFDGVHDKCILDLV
ncbi:hypothetical protein Tco_0357048 [Tanacetum coccineum]